MKWKRGPTDFLSEKTFLIIRDEPDVFEGKECPRPKAKSVAKTDTWPPKVKRIQSLPEEPERPKTANLEKPSILDPDLVDKLDMSLLSKELLCDSMTRFQLAKTISSGGTAAFPSSSRRRQTVAAAEEHQRQQQQQVRCTASVATTWSNSSPTGRHKRRSFEQILDSVRPDISTESPRMQKQARMASQEANPARRQGSEMKKLDDNNNSSKNGASSKVSSLSSVRKKALRTTITSDLELFTSSISAAPEPCKACGRSDQPERFHSHPKGTLLKAKESSTSNKAKQSIPKSIQKPVALNFRSDKNRSKPDDCAAIQESKAKSNGPQEVHEERQSSVTRPLSAPTKKGPKTVTCYICGREFGTASFPIHEPRCIQKWERENNSLPASQRRPMPQRPAVQVSNYEWNEAAWEESQAQLLPCLKCGRTFLPDRLPVHQKSCKATPKNVDSEKSEKYEALNKQAAATRVGPPTVACQVCGRNFGTRSIKIHEPQCMKRSRMNNDGQQSSQTKRESTLVPKSPVAESVQGNASSARPTGETLQKRTVTCYICGRDFGSTSIGIHEPQCLKKWHSENNKLPPNQRRQEPTKPEIIYTHEPETGNIVVDSAAMEEASWKSHLRQLVACKHCGRTFNPDRVSIHERSCKGHY